MSEIDMLLTRRLNEVTKERDAWKDAYEKATETLFVAVGNHAEAEARADAAEAERDALRAACVDARKALKADSARLIPVSGVASALATLDAVLGGT